MRSSKIRGRKGRSRQKAKCEGKSNTAVFEDERWRL
jgi:hypothetical protein